MACFIFITCTNASMYNIQGHKEGGESCKNMTQEGGAVNKLKFLHIRAYCLSIFDVLPFSFFLPCFPFIETTTDSLRITTQTMLSLP